MTLFKVLYWAGVIGQIIIRAPYQRKREKLDRDLRTVTVTEKVLLSLLAVAGLLLPLIYTFTGWLGFADYTLPVWMGGLGAVVFALGLFVFYRAHRDLGRNWSPTLEVYEEHNLVTTGIYGAIRHPMYAAQLLFSIA